MQKQNWFQRTFGTKQLTDAINRPDQTEKIVVIHRDAVGSTGTQNFAGYDHEEYLTQLRGYRRADEFDKIARSDGTVAMLLSAIKNLIRSAVWTVEPADESFEAQQDADLMKHILFEDMETSFEQVLNEALSIIEFGHAVFEVTQKVVMDHPVFGSYVGIKNLGWRSPRTIDRWNLDEQTGKLKSIHQVAYGTLDRFVEIPAEYLLVMTLNRMGSNFEGISMVRPCYGSYKRKLSYMKLNAIGIEKFAIPTPVAEVPQSDNTGTQFDNLIDALENFVNHESQYLTHPKDWKVTLVGNTYDPQKVEYSVDAEDRRMTNAFLANFLSLGSGGTGGSYALSNDLSDFFMAGLDYIAKIIETEINKGVIVNTIKANRGVRSKYPKLTHSDVSDRAGKELADAMKALVDARIVVPDDKLEDQTRERFKLSKKSSEGQRQPQATQQPYPQAFSENKIYKAIKLAEAQKK